VQLYLVDGTYELFRCFHGAPRAVNAAGEEVGAARAVLATFASLLAQAEVTHVAVTFDSLVAPAPPDPLTIQVPLAVAVVRALGLVVWPSGRFSADELLASGARKFRDDPALERIVLCTTDKDNAQCITGDRVVLLDRTRKAFTNEAAVRARFGVGPEQLADLFALVGDRSDGIAGVPGFGLKSAAALLAAFCQIEGIPAGAEAWPASIRGRERLAQILTERRREAEHARDLLRLRDDAPIPYMLDELKWKGADREAVEALVDRLGEPALVERVKRFRSPE
jgi:5'-3' exonuclease